MPRRHAELSHRPGRAPPPGETDDRGARQREFNDGRGRVDENRRRHHSLKLRRQPATSVSRQQAKQAPPKFRARPDEPLPARREREPLTSGQREE